MNALNERGEMDGNPSGKCPKCGKPIEPEWKSCPDCGHRFIGVCTSCEKPVDSEWAYCPSCGESLNPLSTVRQKRGSKARPVPIEDALFWLRRDDDGP